jgi:hypothetical protein
MIDMISSGSPLSALSPCICSYELASNRNTAEFVCCYLCHNRPMAIVCDTRHPFREFLYTTSTETPLCYEMCPYFNR